MAGDWLKMEKSTPDKPEVFAIAGEVGIDPDAVVGKLLRIWSWFDTHTGNGNADRVTPALLDRIAGVPGFVTAMAKSGWIVVSDSGCSLPNFDRHCGQTAKTRAQGAKRAAGFRGRNANTVTEALPREEKRREEKKEQDQKPERASPTGSRLPADWTPTDTELAWAKRERPDVDIAVEAASFRDFWIGKPGAGGRKSDWPATWRNWIRKANAPRRGGTAAGGVGYRRDPGEL